MVDHVVNMDWFECMLLGQLTEDLSFPKAIKVPDHNIRLHRRSYGTQHFKHVYDVVISGREFGLLLAGPRDGNKLDPNFLQFQAKNNVLYEIGFVSEFSAMIEAMSLKWRNPIRIDIALDGAQPMQVMQRVITGQLERVGSQTMAVFFDKSQKITGFDIGKQKSDKWATCYYKSKELEISNKHYIKDFWKRTDLKDQSNVQRIELKLRKNALRAIESFDFLQLESFEYLASIMKTQLQKLWEFTDPEENKNISRRARQDFINWDSIGAQLLPKFTAFPTNEIYRMKMTSKTLFFMYMASDLHVYFQMSQEVAAAIDMMGWWTDLQEKWKREWSAKMGDNADGHIIYERLARFEQYGQFEQLQIFRKDPTKILGPSHVRDPG